MSSATTVQQQRRIKPRKLIRTQISCKPCNVSDCLKDAGLAPPRNLAFFTHDPTSPVVRRLRAALLVKSRLTGLSRHILNPSSPNRQKLKAPTLVNMCIEELPVPARRAVTPLRGPKAKKLLAEARLVSFPFPYPSSKPTEIGSAQWGHKKSFSFSMPGCRTRKASSGFVQSFAGSMRIARLGPADSASGYRNSVVDDVYATKRRKRIYVVPRGDKNANTSSHCSADTSLEGSPVGLGLGRADFETRTLPESVIVMSKAKSAANRVRGQLGDYNRSANTGSAANPPSEYTPTAAASDDPSTNGTVLRPVVVRRRLKLGAAAVS